MATVNFYMSLKLTINSQDGAITERYNLKSGLDTYQQAIPVCQTITTYRGYLLGAGAAVVAASLSREDFSQNRADGVAWPVGQLTGPILMKKINNSTVETTIEPYGPAGIGPRFELPTAVGRVEKRLLRFCRASWISANQFQGVGVVPMSVGTYGALLASYPTNPTIPQAIGVFMSFVRDNTCLIKRGLTNFSSYNFVSGTPDWSIDAVASRTVGRGWPKVRGRKSSFA